MIKLEIEEYCQECLDFTPDVEKGRIIGGDYNCNRIICEPSIETTIRCKNRNRCRAIMRYLKKSAGSSCESHFESPTESPTDDKKGGDER